jgi:hypothetical protein
MMFAPIPPIPIPGNATLTFQVEEAIGAPDPNTHNLTRVTRAVTVEAFVKAIKQTPSSKMYGGLAELDATLEGFLLPNGNLPAELLPGAVAQIERRDLPGAVVQGDFTIDTIGHPLQNTLATIGVPIRGVFRFVDSKAMVGEL